MGSAKSAAGRIYGFYQGAQEKGTAETLRQLELGNLVGKPATDALTWLTDWVCPPGGPLDEAIARDAFTEAVVGLAVEGVTDKRGILGEILPIAAPACVGADDSTFETRFGFRQKQPLIRFRALDPKLVGPSKLPFADFAIPLDEACRISIAAKNILVVENETTFLTLPPIRRPRPPLDDARSTSQTARSSRACMVQDRLLEYATSLITNYSRWDIDSLPNPEFYDAQDDPHVEQTNGAFVPAVVFVLCHEVAHVALGHCTLDNLGVYVSSMDSKLDETAADFYAIDTMTKYSADGNFQRPEATGIIAGLASLLMLSKEVREDRHPDTDERLIAGVRRLGLPDESLLWGLGTAAIKLWDSHYNVSWYGLKKVIHTKLSLTRWPTR
ncbi:MAG: DUF2220 family protein [Verrucomicrobia subdivision 3 bacterium]|nr:DUF2220 family protein [Limisphaerales bacterium]